MSMMTSLLTNLAAAKGLDLRNLDPDALIAELDAYQDTLYPPESRHALDLASLKQANVLFFVARTRPWLFVWDSCGLVLFLLFVRFIVDYRPWPWFAALAVPAILNRESGLYIPVWLALDPLCRAWRRTPRAGRPAAKDCA